VHFIALLHDVTPGISSVEVSITLRGSDAKTWIDSELGGVQLPVNAIAYALCPTDRDIYLEVVRGETRPPTWDRYKGRVVDEIYKSIHEACEKYISSCQARNCDLYAYLISQQDGLIDQAKRKYNTALDGIEQKPEETEIEEFDKALHKIVRLLDFEIARLESANPGKVFNDIFDFNTDFALTAKHQGFTIPATPDFIFRNTIIGDIKSGEWHDFFIYTLVAYALAYEEHTGRPMNYGVILHVELPPSRLVPTYYHTSIEQLSDHYRKRFLLIRDRKLQVIKGGIDPGRPDDVTNCGGCGFHQTCWGATR
jgi:CRISPR/Cas system-associated exonuclease Cas4 (RecB family)